MIDLHVHTNASDGTFSPVAVVKMAAELGLTAVAITDHDTVEGVKPAQDQGKVSGLDVVAGVELSARCDCGSLHILGYLMDTLDRQLLQVLDSLREGRKERTRKIVAKLSGLKLPVTIQDIEREAKGGAHGRPHVARVLVMKGVVRTPQEAFDRFLRRGAPAFAEKVKLDPEIAVQTILAAGGVPVIAHPHTIEDQYMPRLEVMVSRLVSYGVKGIEVFYPKHTPRQKRIYLELADRFNLVATGGTDFHGANKPDVKLGAICSGHPLPYSIIEALRERV